MNSRERREALKRFPFKYNGGGYFRDSRIPKGVVAKLVHGDEILEQFLDFLDGEDKNNIRTPANE